MVSPAVLPGASPGNYGYSHLGVFSFNVFTFETTGSLCLACPYSVARNMFGCFRDWPKTILHFLNIQRKGAGRFGMLGILGAALLSAESPTALCQARSNTILRCSRRSTGASMK